MTRTKLCIVVSAVIAALSHQRADAILNIDLRLTGLTGPGTIVNAKEVINVEAGTVLRFDIFAVVVGTNASTTDDRFVSASGSFRSSPFGPLLGHIEADLVRTTFDPKTGDVLSIGFDGLNSSVGTQQDLDGDGDLDVGSNVDSILADHWHARSFIAPAGLAAGSFSPTTGGRRVGFGTFTVFGPTNFQSTLLRFDGRNAPTAASYFQDGQAVPEPTSDSLVPVTIRGTIIPEPATSAAAAAISSLAALVRRRRR